MFEGQRLTYVVPGYTGHIPTKVYEEFRGLEKAEPTGKIPGYAGYVPAIKPENLYSDTFGKTTQQVSCQSYVKGQDYEAPDKYVSANTTSYMPPSQRFQRTAADIVGVQNKKIDVPAPTISNPGKEVDQFTLSRADNFRETVKGKDTKWCQSNIEERDGKKYVKKPKPLPSYTGFIPRVQANNIFGCTYANSVNCSEHDNANLQHDKEKTFKKQLDSDVPFKF